MVDNRPWRDILRLLERNKGEIHTRAREARTVKTHYQQQTCCKMAAISGTDVSESDVQCWLANDWLLQSLHSGISWTALSCRQEIWQGMDDW